MQTYIATFFSHFGAIRFSRSLKEQQIPCRLMPVPRRVSSSCGTCVRFETESDPAPEGVPRWDSDDLEQLFRGEGEELTLVFSRL